MSPVRDFVDGISEYAPALLLINDLDASTYTGNARFSQSFFDQCAQLQRPVTLMFQETYSTRSQEGHQAGVYDVQFARARAQERGFTGPICYVVSDGWGGDVWDASGYGQGVSDGESGPYFFYGANGVIDSALDGALRGSGAHLLVRGFDGLGGRMVPETWGANNLIGQVVGPSPIPDTDLDHVHADYSGSLGPPTPTSPIQEEEGIVQIFTVNGIGYHLWVSGDGHVRYRAYHSGEPQPIIDISAAQGVVLDPSVKLATVGFGPMFYGATLDGHEAVIAPSAYGYIIKVQ